MRRSSYSKMNCPVARGLERVGEWWTILILRDAFYGLARFDEFQESLGIAPNMLTRRLKGLVDDGLLERRLYEERPPRYEYVLTPAGRDFLPVLLTMIEWGNRNFSPKGPSLEIVEAKSGRTVHPQVVDAKTGNAISGPGYKFAPGIGSDSEMKKRIAKRGAMPFQRPDILRGT